MLQRFQVADEKSQFRLETATPGFVVVFFHIDIKFSEAAFQTARDK